MVGAGGVVGWVGRGGGGLGGREVGLGLDGWGDGVLGSGFVRWSEMGGGVSCGCECALGRSE